MEKSVFGVKFGGRFGRRLVGRWRFKTVIAEKTAGKLSGNAKNLLTSKNFCAIIKATKGRFFRRTVGAAWIV